MVTVEVTKKRVDLPGGTQVLQKTEEILSVPG